GGHRRGQAARPPTPTLLHKGGGRRARGARRDPRHRRREPVAAARHCRDDGLPAVPDGLTNLADAMRQYFLGHGHIRPDCLDQFLFGYKTVGVFNEVAQNLEGLRTQLHVAIRGSQGAAREIERISLELKHVEAAPRLPLPTRPRKQGGLGAGSYDNPLSARLQPLSAKLHASVRTAASGYGTIAAV